MFVYVLVVMLLSIDSMECARGNNNNQFIDDILNIEDNNNEGKTLSSPSLSPTSVAPAAAGPASIKCDTADDRACVAARSNQQQQVSRLKQIRQLSTLLADNLALLDTWQRNKLLAERKEKREQKQIDCNQLPFKQSVQQRSKSSSSVMSATTIMFAN